MHVMRNSWRTLVSGEGGLNVTLSRSRSDAMVAELQPWRAWQVDFRVSRSHRTQTALPQHMQQWKSRHKLSRNCSASLDFLLSIHNLQMHDCQQPRLPTQRSMWKSISSRTSKWHFAIWRNCLFKCSSITLSCFHKADVAANSPFLQFFF